MKYLYGDEVKTFCDVLDILDDIENNKPSNICYRYIKLKGSMSNKSVLGTTVSDICDANLVEVITCKNIILSDSLPVDEDVVSRIVYQITNN